MARAMLKLKRPITEFELDLDENSLEAVGFIRMSEAKTNIALVRQMTVEELAIFCEDGCPPGAPICNSVEMIKGETMKEHCQRCWLNWLKSPVEEVQDGT